MTYLAWASVFVLFIVLLLRGHGQDIVIVGNIDFVLCQARQVSADHICLACFFDIDAGQLDLCYWRWLYQALEEIIERIFRIKEIGAYWKQISHNGITLSIRLFDLLLYKEIFVLFSICILYGLLAIVSSEC